MHTSLLTSKLPPPSIGGACRHITLAKRLRKRLANASSYRLVPEIERRLRAVRGSWSRRHGTEAGEHFVADEARTSELLSGVAGIDNTSDNLLPAKVPDSIDSIMPLPQPTVMKRIVDELGK